MPILTHTLTTICAQVYIKYARIHARARVCTCASSALTERNAAPPGGHGLSLEAIVFLQRQADGKHGRVLLELQGFRKFHQTYVVGLEYYSHDNWRTVISVTIIMVIITINT